MVFWYLFFMVNRKIERVNEVPLKINIIHAISIYRRVFH
jgi:hypothetical protein